MTQVVASENPDFLKTQETLGQKFEDEVVALFNKHLEGGLAPLTVAAGAIGQTLLLMIAAATAQIEDRKSATDDAVKVFDKTVEYVRTSTMNNMDKIVEAMFAPEVPNEQP